MKKKKKNYEYIVYQVCICILKCFPKNLIKNGLKIPADNAFFLYRLLVIETKTGNVGWMCVVVRYTFEFGQLHNHYSSIFISKKFSISKKVIIVA